MTYKNKFMTFIDKNADIRAYIQHAYNGDQESAYNDFNSLLKRTPDNHISFNKATKNSMALCYAGASILLFQQIATAPISLFLITTTIIGTTAIALTFACAYKAYNRYTVPSKEAITFNKLANLARSQFQQHQKALKNSAEHKWRLISQM